MAYLSMLMAHKLRMDAVQSRTSNDIQISQNIQPSCQEPANDNLMLYLLICTPHRKSENLKYKVILIMESYFFHGKFPASELTNISKSTDEHSVL